MIPEQCLELSHTWCKHSHADSPQCSLIFHFFYSPITVFHFFLPLVSSPMLSDHQHWWTTLPQTTAEMHIMFYLSILIYDKSLLSHWAVKTQGRAHEMHHSILIPFMEHSRCQNGTKRPEWKWNEDFMCTCGHKTRLATPDDSSSLLCSLKILHP